MEKSINNSSKQNSIVKNILNKDFIISAIVPIIIFSSFDKFGMTLKGIILSGAWSIGVVILNFVKERKLNALAVMGAAFSGIGVVGTIISNDPSFYLIAPIIQDILLAIIFLGSLFFRRSLIQIIVEQSYLRNASEDFKKQQKYTAAWRIITVSWGILNISQAIVRTILLFTVSMSSYYAISTIYCNVSTPALIAFSILFPRWYWKKVR
ncbi:VC0807 family protein [Clostridium beijerinckii]|uniref:VC0807 family protein n=1 Tax=Clostridium beijerinckii TaxID=1520 RepID=UPI00047A555D|nr:VC0807 family protein [Clostridium beijerinckii]